MADERLIKCDTCGFARVQGAECKRCLMFMAVAYKQYSSRLAAAAFAEGCPVCRKPLQPYDIGYDDLYRLTWVAGCCGQQQTWVDTGRMEIEQRG